MTRRAPNSVVTADDVLRYVAGYLEAHGGVAPSYREIGSALRIPSLGAIARIMSSLHRAGKTYQRPGYARWLEPAQEVPIPRGPSGEPLYFVRIPQ